MTVSFQVSLHTLIPSFGGYVGIVVSISIPISISVGM